MWVDGISLFARAGTRLPTVTTQGTLTVGVKPCNASCVAEDEDEDSGCCLLGTSVPFIGTGFCGQLAHFKVWKEQLTTDEVVQLAMPAVNPLTSTIFTGDDRDIVYSLRQDDSRFTSPRPLNSDAAVDLWDDISPAIVTGDLGRHYRVSWLRDNVIEDLDVYTSTFADGVWSPLVTANEGAATDVTQEHSVTMSNFNSSTIIGLAIGGVGIDGQGSTRIRTLIFDGSAAADPLDALTCAEPTFSFPEKLPTKATTGQRYELYKGVTILELGGGGLIAIYQGVNESNPEHPASELIVATTPDQLEWTVRTIPNTVSKRGWSRGGVVVHFLFFWFGKGKGGRGGRGGEGRRGGRMALMFRRSITRFSLCGGCCTQFIASSRDMEPTAASNIDGRVVIIWTQIRGSNSDIMFMTGQIADGDITFTSLPAPLCKQV